MNAFGKLATVTAQTKRAPAISGGKRGEMEFHLANFKCTPLDVVDAELRQRLTLDTPHELLQTFVDGNLDIREGDLLVVGGKEYPIRAVADWTWRGSVYRHLVVEDLKR